MTTTHTCQYREQLDQLKKAVSEMRHWQREFFRTRSSAAISKAKSCERKVDKILGELERPGLF